MMPEQKNILNARNTDDDRVCSNIISFSNFYTGPRIFVRRVNFVIYSFMYAFSSKTYHITYGCYCFRIQLHGHWMELLDRR